MKKFQSFHFILIDLNIQKKCSLTNSKKFRNRQFSVQFIAKYSKYVIQIIIQLIIIIQNTMHQKSQFNQQQYEQYKIFHQYHKDNKNKLSTVKISSVAQNQIDTSNDNDDCDMCENLEEFQGEIERVAARVMKYKSRKISRMYNLLSARQRIMREYIENKNKNQKAMEKRKLQMQQFMRLMKHKQETIQNKNYQTEISWIQPPISAVTRKRNKIEPQILSQQQSQSFSNEKMARGKRSKGYNIDKREKIQKMEMIIEKNNKYFQSMHHSVVNRLLDIIEHQQNSVISSTLPVSTNLSRVSHRISDCNNKYKEQSNIKQYQINVSQHESPERSFNKVERVSMVQSHQREQSGKIIINNIYSNKGSVSSLSNKVRKPIPQKHQLQEERINKLILKKQSCFQTPRISEHLSYRQSVNNINSINNKSQINKNSHQLTFSDIKQKQNIGRQNGESTQHKMNMERNFDSNKLDDKSIEREKQIPNTDRIPQACQKLQLDLNYSSQKLPNNQIKSAVYLQIPVNQSQNKGLSLAQAFAKKLNGRLPSQRKKQSKQRQNTFSQKENLDPQIIPPKSKRKYKTVTNNKTQEMQISNISTVNYANSEFKTPKSGVNQPSEQLLNRLIYGSKAKVPKKQMYALTKKNYQNLPEVKHKKQQQKKKQLQRQRLEKIKAYQKSIRKGSHDKGRADPIKQEDRFS